MNVTRLLVALLWNIIVLVGYAYVVFVLGYSGWWFALAVILLQDLQDENVSKISV